MLGGVIVCALRSYPTDHSVAMAQLAGKYASVGVVGFDIAGDEGSYPLSLHSGAITEAHRLGVPVTVHAGEWLQDSVKNVRAAVDLGVQRLGHAITLHEDPELMREVAAKGIVVECCLTSNVAKRPGKVASYAEHPIRTMFNAGVKVCINSDNMLLSGDRERVAAPANEVRHLREECGFTHAEVQQVLQNGMDGAFSPAADRTVKAAFAAKLAAWMETVPTSDGSTSSSESGGGDNHRHRRRTPPGEDPGAIGSIGPKLAGKLRETSGADLMCLLGAALSVVDQMANMEERVSKR